MKMNVPICGMSSSAPLVDCTAAVGELVLVAPVTVADALAVNWEKEGSVTPALEHSVCA
jgi:hypothetical protein